MRNVLCPLYGSCLDNAIRKSLPGFNCTGCPHESDCEPVPETEAIRCLFLYAAVFHPDQWQEYRKARSVAFPDPGF
ncbi:MAG: hypothetical protein JRI76_14300 [Deltaproteobacteria bacterium]|nr:hypothetical protein [Deltaproteobacteria bacterium]MBW2043176.1 hypothetical protein [Deltaproteobacteria bacterium]